MFSFLHCFSPPILNFPLHFVASLLDPLFISFSPLLALPSIPSPLLTSLYLFLFPPLFSSPLFTPSRFLPLIPSCILAVQRCGEGQWSHSRTPWENVCDTREWWRALVQRHPAARGTLTDWGGWSGGGERLRRWRRGDGVKRTERLLSMSPRDPTLHHFLVSSRRPSHPSPWLPFTPGLHTHFLLIFRLADRQIFFIPLRSDTVTFMNVPETAVVWDLRATVWM